MAIKLLIAIFLISLLVVIQIECYLKKNRKTTDLEIYNAVRFILGFLILFQIQQASLRPEFLIVLFIANSTITWFLVDPRLSIFEQSYYFLGSSFYCGILIFSGLIGKIYLVLSIVCLVYVIINNKQLHAKYGKIYLPPDSVIGSKTAVEESKNHKDPKNNGSVVI